MMRQLETNYHKQQHGEGMRPMPLFLMPAYSVLPLVREPLGYDIVQPLPALKRTLAVVFLPLAFWWLKVAFTNRPPPENIGQWWLAGFAALCFSASCVVFLRRMAGQKTGQEVHTLECGWSFLAWHSRLPVFLTELVIVPVIFVLAGLAFLTTVSIDLGYWLIACGMSLLLMGTWERRRYYRGMRVPVDGAIEAQTMGVRYQRHEQQARRHHRRLGAGEPEFAELADGPAPAPDAATIRPGRGDLAPEFATWRKPRDASARPQANPGAQLRPRDEDSDFAELG